ncbi:MAG: sulfatase-like hydrolase/transferase, partial [Planctomycetota bacterium]
RPFYTTSAAADFAIEFVDESAKSYAPLFLYVAFNAPHYPLQAPQKAVQKYDGRYDQGWDRLRVARHRKQTRTGLLPERWALSPRPDHVPAWDALDASERQWEADRMEVFAAMVDVLDENVGRIVDRLEVHGMLDNTLLMFCSDNGGCPFERTKGRQYAAWDARSYWTYDAGWAHAGNTPFRLYKQNQHEGGISSPLIVHWPRGLTAEPGAVANQPGHLVDFMATCLDVGGAEYPSTIDDRQIEPLVGRSLAPIFRGETRRPHETLYFHFGTDRALRQGPWKAVSAKLGRWELYHTERDRTELHDLSVEQADRLAKMREEWFRIARQVDRLPAKQLAPVKADLTDLSFRKEARSSDPAKRP